ncbi:MBL fold metallo-hydrolase [Pseudonocardia asaccharolytica]|uniref:MBL fold metallo-hydrolase n=1 Tax=Pseudonocardia asaccharolytica DSM 44247 = NBRC 16224 TaxID=1123024 RepID=A0A511D046_9PSEU|nr:MBL fold metallo-hydrolase [Pseudonocardia asaccharolytica]GEL18169.1 MBL fold metallo-hydrolase [Pseudonocardia asaccharolytica DSM 44247 = NBRC 16224]
MAPIRVTDDDPDGDWTVSGVFRCAPEVYRIPLPLPNDGLRAVNVYAIADDSGWTLIDSGWAIAAAREQLAAGLAALGAGLGDVHRFLITHVHRDHYTQAVVLRREFGGKVLLGRGERQAFAEINRPGRRQGSTVHIERLRRAGAAALAEQVAAYQGEPVDLSVWAAPDEWIEDGAVIAIGANASQRGLTAIETPGHTRGHLVFADPAGELLFAGDHVLPSITPSIGFEPVPPPSPLADFLVSLQLMRDWPDAALLPAHGRVGRRVHERVDELLAHHGQRLDATLKAVADGRTTAAEVAAALPWTRRERALAELDTFNAMLATLETSAHLDVLVERGAVACDEVGGVAHYYPK